MDFDMIYQGGVEEHIGEELERLQAYCFAKMSRFSKFCRFLSKTGEGLKLVAFFIAAQSVLVAHYDGDPDVVIYIGELRQCWKYQKFCICVCICISNTKFGICIC